VAQRAQAATLRSAARDGTPSSACCVPAAWNKRLHFKKFLRVRTEDGRELSFRYYDPRVLNILLDVVGMRTRKQSIA